MAESQKLPSIYALSEGKRPVLYELIAQLSDEPVPSREAIIMVAELDDRIVGTVTAQPSWVVSNQWVERELRGSGLAERMAREISTYNVQGWPEFLCTTNEHTQILAVRFGFQAIKGAVMFRR